MNNQSASESVHIVLCQCTDTKRDEPAPARTLYDESDYFRKQRAYAKAVADAWYVQSAKHGLLHPDTVVEPYDARPKDVGDLEEWAAKIAETLRDYHPDGEPIVEILGGAAYADPLTPALERQGFDVHEPLRGLQIGNRKRRLRELANRPLEHYA